MSFEHQTRHMDCLIFGDIERFQRIRAFLLRCAKVDADDFPDTEAASSFVVFEPDSIADSEFDFCFHTGSNQALQPTPVGRRRWFVKVQVVLRAQSGVAELGRFTSPT